MLRYKTELAWFSRLVWHPAKKWSGCILTTPEPARGYCKMIIWKSATWSIDMGSHGQLYKQVHHHQRQR